MAHDIRWGSALPAFSARHTVLAPLEGDQHRVAPILAGRRQPVRCDVILAYCPANLRWTLAAAESILNQAFAEPVLHLVADGGSAMDDRGLKNALAGVACCRWYRAPNRLGPYRIANNLFDYLETEYYAIQDADDLSAPNRLWRSVRILEDYGYDIFGGAMEQFADYRRRSPLVQTALANAPYQMPGVYWLRTPRGAIIHGAMTCRKSWFERLNGYGDFTSGGDCEFISRAHAAGAKTYVSHQVVAWRRLHDRSLSYSTARTLPAHEQFSPREAQRRFAEWKRTGCNWASYGRLDRCRGGGDLIKLEEDPR